MNETCQGHRENLEAFALRALDAETEASVEAHLLSCQECQAEYQIHLDTVDRLALAIPLYRAPPRLKNRILGATGEEEGKRVALAGLRSSWLAAAASILAIGFAIGAVIWSITLSNEVTRLHDDNQALADELNQLSIDNTALTELAQLDTEQRNALLRLQGDLNSAIFEQERLETTLEEQSTLIVIAMDPDLIPTELRGNILAPDAACNYVWSSKQGVGALTCVDVPSPSAGLAYELWAQKGDTLLSVASFKPDANGAVRLLVDFPEEIAGPVSDLRVTLERTSETVRTEPVGVVVLSPVPVQQATR